MTGNGTLSFTMNGGTTDYTSASGDVVLRYPSAVASTSFVFSYAGGENDEGGAELLYAKRHVGTLIMVR